MIENVMVMGKRKVSADHLADNPDAFMSSVAPCGGHHVNAFRKVRFVSEKRHLGNPEAKIKVSKCDQ